MIHPITLWKKTPVWMGSALSMLIFHVLLLNPQASNNFMTCQKPSKGAKYSTAVTVYANFSLFFMLFLMVAVGD